MFKVTPNPTFKAAVEIPVPGGEPQKLPLVFKHKGKKEVAEFNDAMLKAGNEQDKAKGLQAEADLLYSIIDSWEADVEFNRENFDLLLDQYMAASSAIYETYLVELFGAKRGN